MPKKKTPRPPVGEYRCQFCHRASPVKAWRKQGDRCPLCGKAFATRESCPVCDGDGWYAVPEWADAEKRKVRIRKARCPLGCPLKDNEPGVEPG